jgi:hypothetical protein
MNALGNRERIIRTALMQKVDRLPLAFYFGLWPETYERWKAEGCPAETPQDWAVELDLDAGFVHVDVNLGYCPAFEHAVLEENESVRIVRNALGIVEAQAKDHSTIPKHISNPVKNLDDWQRIKSERLDPDSSARFPANWQTLASGYNSDDRVVQIGWYPYGLFGTLRDMIGVENLLLLFYDDPDLIHTMMEDLTSFWLSIYEKVCQQVRIDLIHIWEDMSGKNGPLISPAMMREFMLPQYKHIKAFADAHKIPVFAVDTDGDVERMIPVLVEGGVNMLLPFEVIEGCKSIVDYRREYPSLCIMGGISKLEIAKGREAIDGELERLREVFDIGTGFIPALDHLVPPEVSYADFKYFVRQLRQFL